MKDKWHELAPYPPPSQVQDKLVKCVEALTTILKKQAKLTSQIAILQIGCGQNNRALRAEGIHAGGIPGYYFKAIYENTWHFQATFGK